MAKFSTLVEALQHWAQNKPHAQALVFRNAKHERRVLTWSSLYTLSGRLAAVLRNKGLTRGDLVINTLPNSPERAVCEIGVWMAGAATVNSQCLLADGSDMLRTVRVSRAATLLVDPDVTGSLWRVLQTHVTRGRDDTVTSSSLPDLKRVVMVRRVEEGGEGNFLTGLEKRVEWFQDDGLTAEDVFTVFTTSGSTGFSKLVVQTHGCYTGLMDREGPVKDFIQHPVFFNLAPLGWSGGCLPLTLVPGTTRVLCDDRAGIPDDMAFFIWRSLQEEGCHAAYFSTMYLPRLTEMASTQREQASSGTQLTELTGTQREQIASHTQLTELVGTQRDEAVSSQPQSTLKVILLGGYPIKRGLVEAALQLSDAVFLIYGSTDTGFATGGLVTDSHSYVDHDSGTLLADVQVKIVDPRDEDTELPRNQVGRILIKTPWMMKGYLNDPEATSAAFTRDGFVRIGDLGCVDERGHVLVQGRGSDAIMRGAYIFYPGWMEARLLACSAVRDVLIVGVPDPILHEELCACVVLASKDASLEQVRLFVETDMVTAENDPLSPRPRHYLRFESFPQTDTFKPKRKAVKTLAAQRLGLSQDTSQAD